MGHEGFYNSLLVAMGNVVSAILMYALQAAWLCQRLIDQDYRQNHGSRLKPLVECKNNSAEPIEMTAAEWTPKRHSPKCRKVETSKSPAAGEPLRKHGEGRRRKYNHRNRVGTNSSEGRLNSSHPYLESSDALTTTVEYVNRLRQNSTLRRAFSDINISSNCSEFRHFDNNQNYLSRVNVNKTTVSVTDQDFLRLIFTKGYVT